MLQVLFPVPTPWGWKPVFGFGVMLFVAYFLCTWLAAYVARREGITKETIQDLSFWIFLGGLVGARITYLTHVPGFRFPTSLAELADFFWTFVSIWEGGIILYGSFLGGTVSYFVAYFLFFRKRGLSTLRLIDCIAPSIALGVALGRVGCLLNGCCFGQVACADCPVVTPIHFPLSAPCRESLVHSGAQTAAGFTTDTSRGRQGGGVGVGAVDPASPAYAAGLRPGAVLLEVNGVQVNSAKELQDTLGSLAAWPPGQWRLALTFQNGPTEDEVTATVYPRTLGVYPTQPYETVSMLLLMLLLLAYYPYRHYPGQVCAMLMACYGVHRYLNELLRDDPRPVGFEAYGSVFLILSGLLLWGILWAVSRYHQPGLVPMTEGGAAPDRASAPAPKANPETVQSGR